MVSGVHVMGVASVACPFLGVSYFQKKAFHGFGGTYDVSCGYRMSLFRGFLFSEKRFSRFRGV